MPKGICYNTGRTHFKKGHPYGNRFKKGQASWSKLHPELMPRKEQHHNWKGGKTKDSNGYVLIYKPEHPFAENGRYVKEHRFVIEQHIGRYLRPEERIHHINRIKTDNRIENLELFANDSEHKKKYSHK